MVVSMTAVGPVGTARRLDLTGGTGGVGKLCGWGGRRCLGLREYAEGQGKCEKTKRHAGFDSIQTGYRRRVVGATRRQFRWRASLLHLAACPLQETMTFS